MRYKLHEDKTLLCLTTETTVQAHKKYSLNE